MKKVICAATLVAAVAAGWSPGANAAKEIEGSYIVTFRPSTSASKSPIHAAPKERPVVAPHFGEHSSGQSKAALARELGIRGEVAAIFDVINSAHLMIDADEAERLSRNPKVLSVRKSVWFDAQTTQANPGWGLDRLDQPLQTTSPPSVSMLDVQYNYPASSIGTGQTIYVLDSGLDLGNSFVAAEFKQDNGMSRAFIRHDFNGGDGADCFGHGTMVAAVAAGKTYGVAKGATVQVVKITGVPGNVCAPGGDLARWYEAFNWLATNGTPGTIVNFSYSLMHGPGLCPTPGGLQPQIWQDLDNLIQAAHNRGVIVVVPAGNDGCNTADFTPSRNTAAFVVGATDLSRLRTPANPNAPGKDARWVAPGGWASRTGTSIAAWAPGSGISTMWKDGRPTTDSGTSLAAPYVAGMFAAGCQLVAPFCSNIKSAAEAFNVLKAKSADTAVDSNGAPLPSGTTSRFIYKSNW